jgi:hypothetical protein
MYNIETRNPFCLAARACSKVIVLRSVVSSPNEAPKRRRGRQNRRAEKQMTYPRRASPATMNIWRSANLAAEVAFRAFLHVSREFFQQHVPVLIEQASAA